MNTCKTCYWWGRDYSGACTRVNSDYGLNYKTQFEIKATTDDDQGLTVLLITGPDFGCIHWRSKKK